MLMKMKQRITIAMAFVLGFALGLAVLSSHASSAPSDSGPRYEHLQFMPNGCSVSVTLGSVKPGFLFIDLHNGNVYCALSDGSVPVRQGNLNLAAIPASQ
jgi:hypothetical protein